MKLNSLSAAVLACSMAILTPDAQALTITRGFSGLWYDAAHSNRGFSAEIVPSSDGKDLMAYWFTVDANGRPQWVAAQGPVVGNKAVLDAIVVSSASSAASTTSPSWGKLTVSFSDCNHGTIVVAPNDHSLPSGQASLKRLTTASDDSCTGGISDDRVAGADSRLFQFFTNTGVVNAANGKLRFEQRSDRAEFNVEIEDLPIGTYSLKVGGSERATIAVTTTINGTEGEVEFRSPIEPGKILLDFDPRGKRVDITRSGITYLTTTSFGSSPTPPAPGSTPPAATPGTTYVLNVELGNDGPELNAKFQDRGSRKDFSVEIEDVAAGAYALEVGGTARGTINVVSVPGGSEGEIEFRNPVEPGKSLLDFDPRGKAIRILRNGTVVLSGTFPSTPVAGNPPGNNGGGSGSGNGGSGGGGNSGGGGDDDHGNHGAGHN